ncbi:hypothetical protein L9F63_005634, partial [Diploptera punctata]
REYVIRRIRVDVLAFVRIIQNLRHVSFIPMHSYRSPIQHLTLPTTFVIKSV